MPRCSWALSLVVVLLASAPRVYAAAGDLDPTFGTGGIVLDPALGGAEDVLVLGSTDILVGGSTNADPGAFAIGRYDSSGALVPTYGTGGHAITSIGAAGDVITTLLWQSDGKIVAVGYTYLVNFDDPSIAVARYDSNGVLDPTFGTGGVAIHNVGPESRGEGAAIQTDGKIVIAGALQGSANGAFVGRLNTDGSVDTSFGTGGFVVETGFGLASQYDAVLIQPDGKIVVAGTDTFIPPNKFLVVRYDTNGQRDASFGTNGAVLTAPTASGGWAFDLDVGPNGTLIATGAGSSIGGNGSRIGVVRYLTNGTPDPSYGGGDGIATMTVPNQTTAYKGVVEPDGRVVTAAFRIKDLVTGNDLVAARFTPDGRTDTAFGGTGWIAVNHGLNDFGASIERQLDGKILVGGTTASSDGMLLVRLLGGLCPPVNTSVGCKTTTRTLGSSLKVKARPGDPARSRLVWKLKRGAATTLSELGDPLGIDDYTLCGYDGSSSPAGAFLFEVTAPPGNAWRTLGTFGFAYKDGAGSSDGTTNVKLKSGLAGNAVAQVKAKGAPFAAPSLPLPTPVVTQLRGSNGTCFTAEYSTKIIRNDGGQFSAKGD
jgi:uncharacterized delta-60 repeat protein